MRARKFDLGRVVATPGFISLVAEHDLNIISFIERHVTGDWGDVDPEDAKQNNEALAYGSRLLSSYTTPDGSQKFWIITEADRSSTTFLLPEEY